MIRWYYIGDKKRLSPCENNKNGECTLTVAGEGLICPGCVDGHCWAAGVKGSPHPVQSCEGLFSLTPPKVVIRPLRNPRKPKPKPESEFGMGTTYCLGLFLKHAERNGNYSSERDAELWFNGASDHLYDMQIPKKCSTELRDRLESFRDKCLEWGHGSPAQKATEGDKAWALNEACELLREIDKDILKVKTDTAQHT